jgi:hypothetical protein
LESLRTKRSRSRAPSRGGRRPDRRLGGPDLGGERAGLRPHVPDAVRRPDPQRSARLDHGGRQHLRADHVNSILAAGRADLVALARPHLVDPMWTLRAAAGHDYHARSTCLRPTGGGMSQLARNMKRDAEAALKA